jgi:hypothetical protein
MRGVHDLGGLPGDEPIDLTEHEAHALEKRVDALKKACPVWRFIASVFPSVIFGRFTAERRVIRWSSMYLSTG